MMMITHLQVRLLLVRALMNFSAAAAAGEAALCEDEMDNASSSSGRKSKDGLRMRLVVRDMMVNEARRCKGEQGLYSCEVGKEGGR
jgi:hypothetical protein